VKLTRAEPGGLDGEGKWRPLELGFRQGSESEAFRKYLDGAFTKGG
jgi:nitrate reductase alpha subunit